MVDINFVSLRPQRMDIATPQEMGLKKNATTEKPVTIVLALWQILPKPRCTLSDKRTLRLCCFGTTNEVRIYV